MRSLPSGRWLEVLGSWEKPSEHSYGLLGEPIQNLVPILGSKLAQLGGQAVSGAPKH